ncbi:MAG: ABC transporter ATP-binding protein [Pseudomonadota bacterium]
MYENVIVETKDLIKTYKQSSIDVPALRGIDLTLKQGEFAVVAGSSGSGKTTLLNLVGALDRPTSGQISVAGKNLKELSGRALANLRLCHIGFVFQAYNLLPVLSAYENAEYVLLLQGISAVERKIRTLEVLAAVGLAGLENRRPAELSGGQQQRVAVARAIAAKPELVLADEPTANLDSKTGTELVDLMKQLNRDHNITYLISSHDPKVIHRADRIIRLEDGEIISDSKNTQ